MPKNTIPTYFSICGIFQIATLGVLLWITGMQELIAQEGPQNKGFSLHAGINSGILSGGGGPSLSLHYASRRDKVLQLESQFLLDYHSGKTFLSGNPQENVGFGFLAGLRLNVRPKKNWNPSLFLFPGLMYSSETISTSSTSTQSSISGAVGLGFSSLFHQKHMVSIGINQGEYITSAFLKYGFWF